jgi:four helix bundle protein
MNPEELKLRTKKFVLQIIDFTESLPRSRVRDVLGKQLLRSATSVGANYRAACRSRSKADFVSKITIVEEEADESSYWLELISELQLVHDDRLQHLIKEAGELTVIFTASGKTARWKK